MSNTVFLFILTIFLIEGKKLKILFFNFVVLIFGDDQIRGLLTHNFIMNGHDMGSSMIWT